MKINSLDDIVKDIINAHSKGNYKLMSKKSIWWIYRTFYYMPIKTFPATYQDLQSYTRTHKILNDFWQYYNINLFFEDTTFNNTLSHIYHNITYLHNVNIQLINFKQACYIINQIRTILNLHQYNIKCSIYTKDKYPYTNVQRRKFKLTLRALSLKDLYPLIKPYTTPYPSNYTQYKIHAIKQLPTIPLYTIIKPTPALFKDCITLHQEAFEYITSPISKEDLNNIYLL